MKVASVFLLVSLLFSISASAGNRDKLIGKNWVVTVPNGNAQLEIHQFFPDEKNLKVLVNCTFPDGRVSVSVDSPVEITDSEIINRYSATQKVYSPSGAYWCMAVVARRVLTYKVINEMQIAIQGDPFIPDGSVLNAQEWKD